MGGAIPDGVVLQANLSTIVHVQRSFGLFGGPCNRVGVCEDRPAYEDSNPHARPGGVSVSGPRGKVVRDAMAEKNKTAFNQYVKDACDILQTERRRWGDTVVDGMLKVYRKDTAQQRRDRLRSLIVVSGYYKLAWDVVSRIAQDQLGQPRRPPREVEHWIKEVLAGTRPQPKTRGRDINEKTMRDRAIVIAVLALTKKGVTATRNGGRHGQCSYDGGSGCDAVGMAVNRIYNAKGKDIKYKNIERIWLDAVANGMTLKEKIPFLFKLPALIIPPGAKRKRSKKSRKRKVPRRPKKTGKD